MLNNKSKYFLTSVIALGLAVCCYAVYFLPFNKIDFGLVFLAAITILFASRLSIQFPGSKIHFLMGDALIFLAFLLYGGETAILLASVEAFCTSLRLKKQGVFAKYSTAWQNAGIMSCSMAATYAAVLLYAHSLGRTPNYNNSTEFFTLLSIMALVQFSANNFFTALGGALKTGKSFRQTFIENCLGSSVIPIAGAAFAGVAYKLIQNFNVFAVTVAIIIVGLLYRTYRQYLGEIRLRQKQAQEAEQERDEEQQRRIEEAERHLEELRQSQQMLQIVIDNVPQYIFWKDRNSVYIGCNRSFATAAGLANPADIIGKTDYDLAWKKEESDVFHQSDRRIIALGEPQYHMREPVHTADGKKAWFDINKVPLRDLQNNIIGILGTSEDVTYQVQIEEERRLLEDQLQQSQKMESVGTLAGGIAHDFNNLITVITINTQLAQRKLESSSPLNRRLDDIAKAADRASALTRQLLAFGRRQTLERKNVNINQVINDVMQMLGRLINEDIEIQIQETSDLALVYADPQQIEQILVNLALNARDAMPRGGRLEIKTDVVSVDETDRRRQALLEAGNYVRISITDSGTGMSAETKQRIFEPFFTTKKVGEGTGLGLAVVYGIVKQHEGLIEAESELGRGTTFNIYLPVPKQAVEDAVLEIQPTFIGGRETILVAEDEPSLRELAQDVLGELGYRVLLAEDGEEAVQTYKSRSAEIDLVVMDIVMPRKSGPEAYQQMKAFNDELPIIFMTGYSDEVVKRKFDRENNIFEKAELTVIQKPYSAETLGSKVREALDKPH